MINRLYAPSNERARRLIAAGCPLDDLSGLKLTAFRKSVQIEQIGGYLESRVMAFGPFQIVYLLGLRLHTHLAQGIVLADWGFRPPGEDHYILWDCDPRQFVPASEYPWHEPFFDSRLSAVMNERRILRRGYPVEGFLCGCAFQTLPESPRSEATAFGKLTVTLDTGDTVTRRISLAVRRNTPRTDKARMARRVGRLFEPPDSVEQKPEMVEAQ